MWRKQLQGHGDIPNKACWQSKSNAKLTRVGQPLLWSQVTDHEHCPAFDSGLMLRLRKKNKNHQWFHASVRVSNSPWLGNFLICTDNAFLVTSPRLILSLIFKSRFTFTAPGYQTQKWTRLGFCLNAFIKQSLSRQIKWNCVPALEMQFC